LQFDSVRSITFSCTRFSDSIEEEGSIIKEKENNDSKKLQPIISVETSIKYMDSDGKQFLIYFSYFFIYFTRLYSNHCNLCINLYVTIVYIIRT